MNAIACLLVILIHVLSMGIHSSDPTSWQTAMIYFPWRLSSFVVPMFLYTGAIKMALQFADAKMTPRVYAKYILQRMTKIYVPYVIWVVIYYACFLGIGYVRGTGTEFFSYLLVGNLSSQFYYIIIVMQFYFLMPVWIWMIRRIPAYLAIAIGLIITFCMQQVSSIVSLMGGTFLYSDRIFLTYLIFWILGLYVGKYYDPVVSSLRSGHGQAVSAVVILFCTVLAYLQFSQGSYVLNMNNIKMIADFLSIILVHFVSLKIVNCPECVRQWMQRIYESSFSVYLSHCLFLTLVTNLLQSRGIHRLSVLLPVRFFVCYTVPFLLYFGQRKVCAQLRGILSPHRL